MAMIPIRFFTDEDVYVQVALDLRAAGFDAVSAAEAIRIGQDDPGQLGRATTQGARWSHSTSATSRLHHVWIRERRHHWGVIVAAATDRRAQPTAAESGTKPDCRRIEGPFGVPQQLAADLIGADVAEQLGPLSEIFDEVSIDRPSRSAILVVRRRVP